MALELREIYFETLVSVKSSYDRIHMAFIDVFIVLLHVGVQLVKVNIAKVLEVNDRKAGNSVEIALPLQRSFFLLDFDVIVYFLLY